MKIVKTGRKNTPRALESKDGSKVCCTIRFDYFIADKLLPDQQEGRIH